MTAGPVRETGIVKLLRQRGPLTGAELRTLLGNDGFALWKTCKLSEHIEIRRVGRRYLRLDRRVQGYARLSPSIWREFLTYTVVGLAEDPVTLAERTEELAARIKAISAQKFRLAERTVSQACSRFLSQDGQEEGRFCVLLAGDIVYEMAHDAPRPERSTGHMVRGSDLDLVFLLNDAAPSELREQLDEAIYQQKYRLLINPSVREEIDYAIKPLARVKEQASFDTFENMVACKILDEAVLLYGSRSLYEAAKGLLAERGIPEKLAEMEAQALVAREQVEKLLLGQTEEALRAEDLHLFYPSEESEEFE